MPHSDPLEYTMMFEEPPKEDGDLSKYRRLSEIRCNVPFVDDPQHFTPESSVEDITLIQQIEASDQFSKMFGMTEETSDELLKQAKAFKPSVSVSARPGTISVARKSANLLRLEEMLRRSRELRQRPS